MKLDFSQYNKIIISPSSFEIIQQISPSSSPQQKSSLQFSKEQIEVETKTSDNQQQQVTKTYIIQYEKQNILSFKFQFQRNQVVLGDINSFYFLNEVHHNLFLSNTQSLINMSSKGFSSQTSLLSNLSTAQVTPNKEIEFQSCNIILANENQFKEVQVIDVTDENEYDKHLKRIKNKLYIDTECNCQTTSCQKNYCSCYSNNNYCIPSICKCKSCQNNPDFTIPLQKNHHSSDKKQNSISCSCSKSYCKKNYCDCFKAGIKCTSLCKCNGCYNQLQNELTIQDNYIAC